MQSPCWVWKGGKSKDGYGKLRFNGLHMYTHRLAYQMGYGSIPKGKQIDHLCRVRHCYNPTHLEAVTQAENIRRGV